MSSTRCVASSVATEHGLQLGLDVMLNSIKLLETNNLWHVTTFVELQLEKPGHYSNRSSKAPAGIAILMKNVITFADGSMTSLKSLTLSE